MSTEKAQMHMVKITVQKKAADKVRAHFPWVYQNEIVTDLAGVTPGELVKLCAPNGKPYATAYANPGSVITLRVLTLKDEAIDREFFCRRIAGALQKRIAMEGVANGMRLVHSEADGLPGLIVDRYGEYLAVQFNTAGIEKFREDILACLVTQLAPKGIVEKSDATSREKEGLETTHGSLHGSVPEQVIFHQHGIRFGIAFETSQKTGFYLDQRRNRKIVTDHLPKGATLLDLFSNTGGFGITAARYKEAKVTLVDSSKEALEQAAQNAGINGVSVTTCQGNVFDELRRRKGVGERYDAIVLDPPPFAKSAGAKAGANRGMKELIVQSLGLLHEGGILAVFSCSHHMGLESLKEVTAQAAADTGAVLTVLEHLFQDSDHPYLLSFPQSLYLTGLLVQKEA